MIKINKVTTKQGDSGLTLSPGCVLSSKASCSIEFLGKLDELNCLVGNALANIGCFENLFSTFLNFSNRSNLLLHKKLLKNLQHDLFDIGAMFYKQNAQNCLELIQEIEQNTKKINDNLPELNSFLLPRGSKFVVALHLVRAATRDCERCFWKHIEDVKKNNYEKSEIDKLLPIGVFLNRLSDLIFVIIRTKSQSTWKMKFKN